MAVNNFREDEESREALSLDIIKRLFSYLKPYRVQILQVLALMGAVIGVELLNPYFLKLGIDKYIKNNDGRGMLLLGLGMVIVNIVAMFCARQRIRMMTSITNRILVNIRHELYAHIQKLSFSFFDERPIGKILARIIGDVNSLNDLFTNSVTSLIPDLIKITAVVAIMLAMNFRLGLAAFATLPFLVIFMTLVQVVAEKRWELLRKKNSNLNAFAHEDFSGMKVVQSFAAEKITSRTFFDLLRQNRTAFVRAARINDFFWPVVEISWGVGVVVIYWYGLKLIDSGSITVGLLVAFTGYISMFWQPIMNLSNFYNNLITNISGAKRIFEIMDIVPDITDGERAAALPPIAGNVTFENVSFGYEDTRNVLDNVSFHINEGETVALVGATGAGKTTIVNLISRFYDVGAGHVRIDGIDVRDVTIESLRSQMGIMMQDTFLFSGTIRDNIRYGKLDATDEEIIEAAKAVQAHDFIMRLEKGYDTQVNERGSRLSAGQRQLIAFVRALLANPRILILDEATASIDTQTERLLQEGIHRLLQGRTSFVIAHRLSTIQSADRILVIGEGGIQEMGDHGALLEKKGVYYNLFMSQFKFLREEQSA